MSTAAKWFDEAYNSGAYTRHWETQSASPELIALAAAEIVTRDMRVLDVGCGTGREAIYLAKLGCNVTGIDFSESGIAIARERAREANLPVEFLRASTLEIPLPDDTFDLVNDRGCLHHIPEEKRHLYASETSRVLKSGGLLFIRGSRDAGPQHFVPVTRDSLDRHFPAQLWTHGPVLEMATMSEQKVLPANMVLFRKK